MPLTEPLGLHGIVRWVLTCPDGVVKSAGEVNNLVTQIGDQAAGERMAGIMTLGVPLGMVLGTGGATNPTKTGAGAGIVTLVASSYLALDATYPQSGLNGAARRITYRCTYGAGVGTSATAITEVVLVNVAASVGLAANTYARAVITGGVKGALDVLAVTWLTDVQGT